MPVGRSVAVTVFPTLAVGVAVEDPIDAAIWNNKYFVWFSEFGGEPPRPSSGAEEGGGSSPAGRWRNGRPVSARRVRWSDAARSRSGRQRRNPSRGPRPTPACAVTTIPR